MTHRIRYILACISAMMLVAVFSSSAQDLSEQRARKNRLEKDIAKLADILGHASINTTRIYIVTTGAEHKRKMEHMRLII